MPSETIPGDKDNYGWPVYFTYREGYLRIVQDQDGRNDVVLLSPNQVQALTEYIGAGPYIAVVPADDEPPKSVLQRLLIWRRAG